ncbi:MAG TPA: helix-turn-helix transcriptional regulator [Tepidisphaeraceae bacterium]|nr:helix-turn-helix transcriptional regulator [Tepidisphaeraceae bacterium]
MSRKSVPISRRSEPAPLRVLTPEQWASVSSALRLSPRQRHIVELIMQGKQDKEIARELNIAFSTVRTQLGRIFRRLSVSDRMGLVLLVCMECLRARHGADVGSNDDGKAADL